jgi:MurNAc alpha-1-phosphate uridylyltransferase
MATELVGVVLAAGRGERLRPLTDRQPKALCPVGNVPLVDLAIDRVTPYAGAVAVNVHHWRDRMVAHLGGRVHVSVEVPDALGTAGAVGRLRDWVDGRGVLIVNADSWSEDDVSDLVSGWDGERVRLRVVDDPDRRDFGPWRYAGAALMPWSAVRLLTPQPAGLYEVCWRSAYAEGRLDLAPTDRRWIDCGTPKGYLAANLASSRGDSVVGEGAVIDGIIERCVVWPGGRVAAGEHLVDAIRVGADLTVQAGG